MALLTKKLDNKGERTRSRIKVTESFSSDQARTDYSAVTQRLLAVIPDKYLVGLDSIVICNLSEQPRKVRIGTLPSRGRKVRREHVAGLYHGIWRGERAWIQIFADQVPELPRYLRWIRPLSELTYGQILYHEIGHHVHAVIPEYRQKEDVADDWSVRFSVAYLRRAYWYLYPFLWSASMLYRAFREIRRKTGQRQH